MSRREHGLTEDSERRLTAMTARKGLALVLAAAALPVAAQDNPLLRRVPADLTTLRGYWNGANLENRSNCATSGVNGQHGTYAQYFFTVTPSDNSMSVHETTVTNLTCDYAGTTSGGGPQPAWSGTF